MGKVRIDPADLEVRGFAVYVREQHGTTPRLEARLTDGFVISTARRAWLRRLLGARANVHWAAATDHGVAVEFSNVSAMQEALSWFEAFVAEHVRPLAKVQPHGVQYDVAALERAAIAFVERNPRCTMDACTTALDAPPNVAAEIVERLVATGRLIDHARDESTARK